MQKVDVNIYINRQGYQTEMSCIHKGKKVSQSLVFINKNGFSRNRMELLAVTEVLEHIKMPVFLNFTSLSDYLPGVLHNRWYIAWHQNDWKTAKGKPVANAKEWRYLLELMGKANHKYTFLRKDGTKWEI